MTVELERLKPEALTPLLDRLGREEDEDWDELREDTFEPESLDEDTSLVEESERTPLWEELLILEELAREPEPAVLFEAKLLPTWRTSLRAKVFAALEWTIPERFTTGFTLS